MSQASVHGPRRLRLHVLLGSALVLSVMALIVTPFAAAAADGTVSITASPSDPRAVFGEGNVTTCDAVGLGDDTQVGADGSASDANVSGVVKTNAGTIQPGTGGEVDITLLNAGVVIDAVVVKGGPDHNSYVNPLYLPPTLSPDQHYIAPLVGAGNVPTISHWFACYRLDAPTSTVTTIRDAGNSVVTSVPLGTTVHDRAVVSGTGFGTPTGNVTFTFFTAASDCSGASVGAGTVALDGSGVANPSDSQGPLAAGAYSFQATYNGDSNYGGSTGDCEPLAVNMAGTSTVTTIRDAGNSVVTSVPLGTTVHDRAVVSGTGFGTPTGNVTFTFFTAASDCSGASVGAGTVALDGSGVANPSASQGPLATGAYSFRATYNGDTNYAASTGDCEPLTVTASVDLQITKTDGGARPVVGEGQFTYTLAVDNLGPADAQVDASVVDVLPAEITFISFGSLPVGVSCTPPAGQTINCTIVKGLLEVADPPVSIPINVSVKAGTTVASVTNKTIVTSPDDVAPCTVTDTNITCEPSDTNNYAQVITPLAAAAGVVVTSPQTAAATVDPPAATALAFTGSDTGLLVLAGAALVGIGGIFLLASRRRKRATVGS